jgi:biotin synthase
MSQEVSSVNRWLQLADRVLAGATLTEPEGLAILQSPDHELLEVLAAAYRVRHHWFGNRMHLNLLVNAKSGACGEDCGYCSQSRVSQADIPRYRLLEPHEIIAGADLAIERGAGTYCIVTSGRSPNPADMAAVCASVTRIKRAHPSLHICYSAGLLSPQQAATLKAAGVDRVNHNLNTSRRWYPRICTTHSYDDRLATLAAVRGAGMQLCCGGIVGMGEDDADVVELALRVGALKVEAVPVNFLIPIPGIALENTRPLTPRYCLKVLAMFRLANPQAELRIAGGRELHLGPLQPLGLYAANSIFLGDYLTTKGQTPVEDYRMIEALGFEPVLEATGQPAAIPSDA